MSIKNLSILALLMLLLGCSDAERDDATINYSITALPDSTINQFFCTFLYTRAHHENNSIHTVYLDEKPINFNLTNPIPISLGSSTIEPEKITGFDFGLEDAFVIKNNDTFQLVETYWFDDFSAFNLSPTKNEEINLNFIIDVNASILLDSAGKNWIKPKIMVERN